MEYDHEGSDAGLFAFAFLVILFVFVFLGGCIYAGVQEERDARDFENHLEHIGFVSPEVFRGSGIAQATLGSCRIELETRVYEQLVVWYRSPANNRVSLRIVDAAGVRMLLQLPEMRKCY